MGWNKFGLTWYIWYTSRYDYLVLIYLIYDSDSLDYIRYALDIEDQIWSSCYNHPTEERISMNIEYNFDFQASL